MTTSDIQLPGIDKLAALAQTYFDAAHDMDADKFASIFHEAAFVTRNGENETVVVTPVAAWLDTVRTLKPPREAGAARLFSDLEVCRCRHDVLFAAARRVRSNIRRLHGRPADFPATARLTTISI